MLRYVSNLLLLNKVSADPIHLPLALQSGTHDIWDYLTLLDDHLVILGAPGSGKTTLLKHLGLSLVQKRHHRKMRTKQLPWTIPLFLPLREHGSQLKEHRDYSLVDAANVQIHKWKQAIPPEWFESLLQKGHCLVLLDGLDEIADTVQRQQMVNWVQQQMLAYPKNRFVITSRPLGYRSNPFDRVAVLEVQPFTFEQVTRFLHAWYLSNEIKRAVHDDPGVRMRAHDGAEDLLKRLHTTPALFAMAVNPLLLTMIATVHLYYGQLPGARITLYKAICEVFLSRRTEMPNSPQELRAEQRQLVLQSLAYSLMQQGRREISREDACRIITTPLQLVSSTQTPQDFLDHLEAITSGLLLEREQGEYSFAHQTFQEYLAMIYIQENHLEHELLSYVDSSWWHETILLFCAQADATAILQACITQSLPSLEALTLAIDCVEEARTVKAEVKERLYLLLEQGINDAEPERRKVIAEALLKRRLQQMLPLQGVTFVDKSLVTCAEYQLFLDEQRAYGHNPAPDTWSNDTFQGYGRDPLRGVRKEDTKLFCQWLTERDREGQSYRLPRREERQQIQKALGTRLPADISYWEEDGSVVWSHGSPSRLLQEQVLKALIDHRALAIDRAIDRAIAIDRTLASTIDLDHARASTIALARATTSAIASEIARALAGEITSVNNLAIANEIARALAGEITSVNNLGRALAGDLSRAISRAPTPARPRTPSTAPSPPLALSPSTAPSPVTLPLISPSTSPSPSPAPSTSPRPRPHPRQHHRPRPCPRHHQRPRHRPRPCHRPRPRSRS